MKYSFNVLENPAASKPMLAALLCLVAVQTPACSPDPPPTIEERLLEQPGFWFAARPDPALSEHQQRLAALGYSDGYNPADGATGVVLNAGDACEPGLNLYSSGHGSEAVLMDREGTVRHRWGFRYEDLDGAPPMEHPSQLGWRRVRMLADGSLLAIHGGLALFKLSHDSKLQWVYPGRAHHDLEVLPDGRILTLTRRPRIVPSLNSKRPTVEDFIAVLSPEGELLQELSLIEALRSSSWFNKALEHARTPARVAALTMGEVEALDFLHANSVQILDGSQVKIDRAFAAGNVLVCLRELNALVVVDLKRERIIWYREGAWLAPHDPRLLPSGNILLFDNLGNHGFSQALEFDVRTGTERWAYRGEPADQFTSVFCGTARRLAGGNTLLTESCNGRAIEVSPEGEPVWVFRSPHRAGSDNDLVAVLFEVERIPYDQLHWLD